MTDIEIIKALECLMHYNCEDCPYYRDDCADRIKDPIELSKYALDLINRKQAENDDLLYKLTGVMHSVDKWLDGDELKQDEVNRAATMREKTLQIVEKQQAEIEKLKDILYDAEGVNLVNYWYQQCEIAENGNRNFDEENKKLKAEIEKLKNENGSMREDIAQSVNELKNLGVLYAKDISKSKFEAIKELIDELEPDHTFEIQRDDGYWEKVVGLESIKAIAKELVGGD